MEDSTVSNTMKDLLCSNKSVSLCIAMSNSSIFMTELVKRIKYYYEQKSRVEDIKYQNIISTCLVNFIRSLQAIYNAMPSDELKMKLIIEYELFELLKPAVEDKTVIVANQIAKELFENINTLLLNSSSNR